MKKEIAEFIGTFTLVLFGCGAAVIAGDAIGILGISLAFGLALIAMAYGIGPVSGCHINPAVSFGAYIAGHMTLREFIRYAFAQCLGAIVGAFILMTIAKGQLSGYDVGASGLGQNGWGADYMGGYGMQAAFIFEFLATAIFVLVILGSTQKDGAGHVAGLAIGLTLAVIHIVGINITGVSVNPARSLGPAIFAGGDAMGQLWLFVIAPMAGALFAAVLAKMGWLEAE
ncbi:MAG: aquaporin [Micavibrio sp.]|nr:MAG: aquaporin [Micavibrio sp.]